MQALVGLSEPVARAVSTIVLRGIGFALIGLLRSLLVGHWRLRWAAPDLENLRARLTRQPRDGRRDAVCPGRAQP